MNRPASKESRMRSINVSFRTRWTANGWLKIRKMFANFSELFCKEHRQIAKLRIIIKNNILESITTPFIINRITTISTPTSARCQHWYLGWTGEFSRFDLSRILCDVSKSRARRNPPQAAPWQNHCLFKIGNYQFSLSRSLSDLPDLARIVLELAQIHPLNRHWIHSNPLQHADLDQNSKTFCWNPLSPTGS